MLKGVFIKFLRYVFTLQWYNKSAISLSFGYFANLSFFGLVGSCLIGIVIMALLVGGSGGSPLNTSIGLLNKDVTVVFFAYWVRIFLLTLCTSCVSWFFFGYYLPLLKNGDLPGFKVGYSTSNSELSFRRQRFTRFGVSYMPPSTTLVGYTVSTIIGLIMVLVMPIMFVCIAAFLLATSGSMCLLWCIHLIAEVWLCVLVLSAFCMHYSTARLGVIKASICFCVFYILSRLPRGVLSSSLVQVGQSGVDWKLCSVLLKWFFMCLPRFDFVASTVLLTSYNAPADAIIFWDILLNLSIFNIFVLIIISYLSKNFYNTKTK